MWNTACEKNMATTHKGTSTNWLQQDEFILYCKQNQAWTRCLPGGYSKIIYNIWGELSLFPTQNGKSETSSRPNWFFKNHNFLNLVVWPDHERDWNCCSTYSRPVGAVSLTDLSLRLVLVLQVVTKKKFLHENKSFLFTFLFLFLHLIPCYTLNSQISFQMFCITNVF